MELPALVDLSAIALFLLAMFFEFVVAKILRQKIYSGFDSLTNLLLYSGSLVIDFLWVPLIFTVYGQVHAHSLTKLGYQWWMFQGTVPAWHWFALLLADDFCFYCFHRMSHKVWLLWASHENHHSSNFFNLTVAARQTWTPFLAFLFWLPLAWIGFDPLMILTMQLIGLFYQAMLHTELIRNFGPLDWILNSPSHHRVHHGSNPQYLDRNFGGIFIVWDRLLGTFAAEDEKVVYGTGETERWYHPFKEYIRLARTRRFSALFQSPGAT